MARALFDDKVEITKMRVAVFTLGCKTNLYESGQIVSALCAAGHDAFHGLEPADVFVLNTCAITAEAEKKSRQLVARARKLNPNCRVVVVGCASEKNPAQFEDLANVTVVKGVYGKTKVVEEILGEGVERGANSVRLRGNRCVHAGTHTGICQNSGRMKQFLFLLYRAVFARP